MPENGKFSIDPAFEGQTFLREMEEGQIHFRDRLQFALKSEFKTSKQDDLGKDLPVYLQEIYIFIPQTLQINSNTYTKDDFYHDETNIIRFKTPVIKFADVVSDEMVSNPLNYIQENLQILPPTLLIRELKMYGNIYRSALRQEVKQLLSALELSEDSLNENVHQFTLNIQKGRENYEKVRVYLEDSIQDEHVRKAIDLVDEFLVLTTENLVAGFLYFFGKKHAEMPAYKELLDSLSTEVKRAAKKREFFDEEVVLLHQSELNRYMYDALSLKNSRVELSKKHGAYIGMVAAGAAMLVYMTLFVWKANTFGINSVPFVLLVVLSYILKDRIKEGLKELYHKNAYRWFPDYSTEINTSENEPVGYMNESFIFMDPEKVPKEFINFRSEDQIEELSRVEDIIQYKKELVFTTGIPMELNTIFRFNIHKFLEKAGDEKQRRFVFNESDDTIQEKKLPKIYLLTLLLKDTYENKSEIKKFQVVLNKSGIERVQYLGSRFSQ